MLCDEHNPACIAQVTVTPIVLAGGLVALFLRFFSVAALRAALGIGVTAPGKAAGVAPAPA